MSYKGAVTVAASGTKNLRNTNSNLPRTRLMAPKGYTDHDIAGSKLANMAAQHRVGTMRGTPVNLKKGK